MGQTLVLILKFFRVFESKEDVQGSTMVTNESLKRGRKPYHGRVLIPHNIKINIGMLVLCIHLS